ncbi:hypothetical protein BDP81DRAFT_47243 [Colletotrichum phormii]|uniref:Uncharacterized protein n=1 Tax=Colletotrichum phormii TaxID=359342 RepID=A0AAJ0EDZ2_9PEZI|nr:uncharacterized protein BDP81DRAFT_47243 [Colletotrichum phormii]KAK1635243.1 hypothetical protein BDP81DRAFT_47243 [Colletotrichum phormii]
MCHFCSSPGPCHSYSSAIADRSARADPVSVGRPFNSLISTHYPSSLEANSGSRARIDIERFQRGRPAGWPPTSSLRLPVLSDTNLNHFSPPVASHLLNRPPQPIASHPVRSYLRHPNCICYSHTLNSLIRRQAPLHLLAQTFLFSLHTQASSLPN